MATFLRNLRRSGSADDLAELQQLATRLESQQASLSELVQHADRSIGQLQRLGTLGERVSVLERQLSGLEHLTARLGAAESQLSGLTGRHQKLDDQLAETGQRIEEARGSVTTLTGAVDRAAKLHGELSGFLELESPFRDLRGDLDGLRAQSDQFRVELGRLREQHESTLGGYKAASTRMEGFDGEWQRITRTLTETEHRIAGLEQLLADMAPVAEGVAQTRRQLATAKVTADQLAQRVAGLEQQRDQIDRATAKLEHLHALMQRTDQGLERHAETSRMLADLKAELEGLEEAHGSVLDRTRGIAERLERIESAQALVERDVAGLREGVDQHGERLTLEARGLQGVAQRVTDLRRTLGEWEERFTALAAGAEAITSAAARADTLTSQVASITAELQSVGELGARAHAGLADLERLEQSVSGLTERTCRLEEARPAIERTIRDLGSLGATSEAIGEALEQLRTARQELGETRGAMDATRTWLGETDRSVSGLRNDVAGIDRMRATVDAVRQELEQLTAAMSVVESRKGLVDDVQRRLTEASTLGASVEDRARGLAERIEAAEDHLGTLVPRLDEVGRAGNQLVSLGAGLRSMEERVETVETSVTQIEGRARSIEALGERMKELSREIDQRQHALQRATEHLDRASTLRQEAAEAAQLLADRARDVSGSLDQADERLEGIRALSRDLEGRLSGLSATQERLTVFENRLAEWRGVEQQLNLAMEQAAARQATITTLSTEIRALFDAAERTQADARAIAEAQPQLARTRAELDQMLGRLDDGDGLLRKLEDRRRQIDRAEERLAHADTLLGDVRAALETLLTQKAQVDHFVEKTQSLLYESRRVEGLIETLREERRMTDRIQTALADLRRQDEVRTETVAE